MEENLKQAVILAVKTIYGKDVADAQIQIQKTKKEFEGDLTLVVFPLLKLSGKKPEDTANEIGAYLMQNWANAKNFNVVKGFLNISLKKSAISEMLLKIDADPDFGITPVTDQSKKIVLEFSSPNTNKPLHLGHLRNNFLGDSISRILKAGGNNVIKVNLVNDRGIHICKSMLAWKKWGHGETPETSGIKGDHLIGNYYVEFDKHYKAEIKELMAQGMTEDDAKQKAPSIIEAHQMLQKWEQGDPDTVALWKTMNSWVYDGFDVTYKLMGITFDKIYHESETYLEGKQYVVDALEKGICQKDETGATYIDLTADGLDKKILLRSDGTTVYMTQDLGTAAMRHREWNFDEHIYVVGNEQDYHFKVLKLILGKLGFDWADKVYHLSYGMVELPNGKMKSREGTVVDADDLIAEMEVTAEEMCRDHGKNDDMTPDQLKALYHMLALGALKYFILKVDPTKNMLFNPAESIDFNGNTGPFIQYTHARICSIVRKAAEHGVNLQDALSAPVTLTDKERAVVKCLHDLPSTVASAAANFSPAMIANYAYDLAKSFNSFYQDTPILRETDTNLRLFRVKLCSLVAVSLKNAMRILGIEVPERM